MGLCAPWTSCTEVFEHIVDGTLHHIMDGTLHHKHAVIVTIKGFLNNICLNPEARGQQVSDAEEGQLTETESCLSSEDPHALSCSAYVLVFSHSGSKLSMSSQPYQISEPSGSTEDTPYRSSLIPRRDSLPQDDRLCGILQPPWPATWLPHHLHSNNQPVPHNRSQCQLEVSITEYNQ